MTGFAILEKQRTLKTNATGSLRLSQELRASTAIVKLESGLPKSSTKVSNIPLGVTPLSKKQAPLEPQQLNGSTENSPTLGSLTYQWERFGNFSRELPPLFKRHWQEIALNQDRVPLDPDWDRYFAYDLANILHCLTIRSNGVLVGYVFILVYPHLHYASTLWAQTDIFWLDPAYRQGLTGYRMLRLVENHLKQIGVKVVFANAKLHFEASRGTIGKLLERLGYKPVEILYSKFIG